MIGLRGIEAFRTVMEIGVLEGRLVGEPDLSTLVYERRKKHPLRLGLPRLSELGEIPQRLEAGSPLRATLTCIVDSS